MIAAIFDGLNRYLGNYLGEFAGELCLNAFFLLSARAMWRGKVGPRWVAAFGFATGTLGGIAMWRNVTGLVAPAAALNNVALPLWMIVFGVTLMARSISGPPSSYNTLMTLISGRLIAAGRALAGVSQADFATACGLDVDALCRLESGGSAWVSSDAHVEAVTRGMNHFGVMIVEETDNLGAGVRLKFTRTDARQIARLESEGGVVGSDDAP